MSKPPGPLAPFRDPWFTLYFSGQVVSNVGTWFQNLALSLVVLQVTGSAQALGGVTIAQFLPILAFSLIAGRLADRIRPRTILLWTSAASTVLVSGLGVAVAFSDTSLWVVYALIAAGGTANAFERVAAQAIVYELVGPGQLSRGVSLSTIALAAARSIGPGLAGVVFAAYGPVVCMAANAASYLVVFAVMLAIPPARLHARHDIRMTREPPTPIRGNRDFTTIVIVNVVVALLSLNMMLVITATVSIGFEASAEALGAAHALNAVGAIAGGMLAAVPQSVAPRLLIGGAGALGITLLASAAAPTLTVFLLVAPLLGFGYGYYQGTINAAAQTSVAPAQIGRAMSIMLLGSQGMAPLGAALMGWVIDWSSGQTALYIGGSAALVAAAFVWLRTRSRPGDDTV